MARSYLGDDAERARVLAERQRIADEKAETERQAREARIAETQRQLRAQTDKLAAELAAKQAKGK